MRTTCRQVTVSDCNRLNRLQVTTCLPPSTVWDCARRHDDDNDDNTLAPTRGRSNDYFSFATWHIGVGKPWCSPVSIALKMHMAQYCRVF